MAYGKLQLRMGLTRVKVPQFASEPGYVQQVNAAMKALTEDLVDIFDQFEDISPDIIMEAMEPTFKKSQTYCPYRTGDLRNSGYLEVASRSRGGQRVEMGYAKGGKPRYAAQVHENLEMFHRSPTRAKWLEAAINEDTTAISDRIADGYKRFMGA